MDSKFVMARLPSYIISSFDDDRIGRLLSGKTGLPHGAIEDDEIVDIDFEDYH